VVNDYRGRRLKEGEMAEFETSLELLIALGICQITARPNDKRLLRAQVTTRYLELGATPPTISSQQLAVLRAWMVRQTPGRATQ
jgi:hypothetical protein